ncbi:MAG: DUF1295 domain-containing protein [Crocinitomicaceae bacterium]|nr:DUF1295 domain-containing protein [Crocinitomicaceae bacterium]
MTQKKKDLLEIVLIYIIIGIAGVLSYRFIQTKDIEWDLLIADLVMTVVSFIFSLLKKNSSVYDAFWSVIPFYFVLLFAVELYSYLDWKQWVFFLVVSLWSWRLTLSWARGWAGFHHEDFRYVDLAKQSGKMYPFVNFLGIHLFPTLMVFGCFWPALWIIGPEPKFEWLFYIGSLISIVGIWLELQADNELAKFRRRPNPKTEDLLDSGIWGQIRYPNYLGEMLFWLGVFVSGIAYRAPLYTGVGVVALILMFFFISIPMKDKRMASRREGYEEYKKNVPMVIPRIFKKS